MPVDVTDFLWVYNFQKKHSRLNGVDESQTKKFVEEVHVEFI